MLGTLFNQTRGLLPFFCLLGVVALGVGLAVCARGRMIPLPAAPAPGGETPFPRTLHSPAGEDLVLAGPPSRIIALSTAAEEIIIDLAGTSRLAAVTPFVRDPHFSSAAARAAEVPEVVRSSMLERIIRLEPDLVFVASYTDARNREVLRQSGIPICPLAEFKSIDSIEETIRLLGYALGAEKAADSLIADMDRTLRSATERVAAARARQGFTAPRVLYLEMPGGRLDGAWTAGSQTVIDDIIRAAGAVNVAAGAGVVHESGVSPEVLIHWNPSWLVVPGEPSGKEAMLEALSGDPVIGALEAVRSRHVILIPTRTITATSHLCVRAVPILLDELFSR